MNTPNFDPILGNSRNYDECLREYDAAKERLEQRKRTLMQMMNQEQQQQNPQKSQTPVWDEIDAVVADMSDQELVIVTENDEYKASDAAIAKVQHALLMQMLRPMVEGCPAGKDALEKHLTLIKRLRKTAIDEANREIADFKEYTEKYSHLTFDQYKEMKAVGGTAENGKPKKGGKA